MRTVAFWGGLVLIVAGVVFAWIGVAGMIRNRSTQSDLDSMIGELRANGAIVENYHEVLEDKISRTTPSPNYRPFLISGILVTAGATMMVLARKPADPLPAP